MVDAEPRSAHVSSGGRPPARTRLGVLVLAPALAVGGWLQRARVLEPRLAGDDPRDVVTAYFEARSLGMWWLAGRVQSDAVRSRGLLDHPAEAWIDDALLATDLRTEGPLAVGQGPIDDAVQFVVTYRSRWTSETGQPPGPRIWFVRLGRERGSPWRVLGQGTGP